MTCLLHPLPLIYGCLKAYKNSMASDMDEHFAKIYDKKSVRKKLGPGLLKIIPTFWL